MRGFAFKWTFFMWRVSGIKFLKYYQFNARAALCIKFIYMGPVKYCFPVRN